MRALQARPALRIPGDPPRAARGLQVLQVAQRLGEPPLRVRLGDGLAMEIRDDLEDRRLAGPADRLADLAQPLGDQLAVGVDVGAHVGEGAPVPGEAQARVEVLDLLQRGEELAGGIGRVAVVVVDRDAPEQVVAGDQQPALGLEEADVRRRVTRRLQNPPGAEVGPDLDALDERAVGLDDPRDAEALAAARLARRLDGGGWHPALQRDLQPPLQRGGRVGGRLRHVLVVGVHPQLAARAVDDRTGLAVVVGVRMGADEQPHVLDAQVDHVHRPFEVRERPRPVPPRVDEDDAVAGGEGPRVAVRDAGPRQRQAQAPDAGQHALAAAQLASAPRGRHALLRLAEQPTRKRSAWRRPPRRPRPRKRSPAATSALWSAWIAAPSGSGTTTRAAPGSTAATRSTARPPWSRTSTRSTARSRTSAWRS